MNSKSSKDTDGNTKLSPKKLSNGETTDNNFFCEGNLPPHHYKTVKLWIERLMESMDEFAKKLDKKVLSNKNEKLFQSESFCLEDINKVLKNCYQAIDTSVEGLLQFRNDIQDYLSTWKVVLAEGIESSEGSLDCPQLQDEGSQDSVKIEKSEENIPKIRVLNIDELNNLVKPNKLNEKSNKSCGNQPCPTISNHINISSSSDDCTICSDNEEKIPKKKLSLSTSKHEDNIQKSTNEKKNDVSTSNDDDVCIVSDLNKSNSKDDVKKGADETNKPFSINWDTSTSESTERNWVITSKSKKKNEEQNKSKKKLRSKKERSRSKKENIFSSSEEDMSKLLNLTNLKKRRRASSSSSSVSQAEQKESKKKIINKSKKLKENPVTLMDCMNSNEDSDISGDSDVDLNFEFANKLKSLQKNYEPQVEDFGKILTDSDGSVDVLTDSSLDSIVNKLVSQRLTVRRYTSKKKKEEPTGENSKSKFRRRTRDKLLDEKLTDTDTEEGEEKWKKYKTNTKKNSSNSSSGTENEEVTPVKKDKDANRSTKNKKKKKLFSDDSEVENLSDSSSESTKKEDDNDKDSEEEEKDDKKTKKRRRIRKLSGSSSDNGEPTPSKSDGKGGRKNIRRVLTEENLAKTTKEALKEEEERKRRIAEKQKLYNDLLGKAAVGDKVNNLDELVLDFDIDTKEPLVAVDRDLVKKLKPHQGEGIKFMWDSCFESVKDSKKGKGSGCILAHCMGLGKTLQVITLVHTLLTSEEVDVNRVLIVAPFSTVQNWVNEFKMWLKDIGSGEDIEIYDLLKTSASYRSYRLRDWERTGGVMIIGYNLFRSLVAPNKRMKKAVKKTVDEVLLDPGPDVVVCDEGHILKNQKSAVNNAMNRIKTRRKIVLTGTPLQNNLKEYHCMVQFVKPNLLGTLKEFQNRFVHPIQNGQFEDSTAHDVKVMKRRAHVLHKMLDGIVQRKDYNVLTPYLPPKYEYVIHLKLSEVQCKLYRYYLDNLARKGSGNVGGGLFQDFQHLLRICTHPRALLIHSDKAIKNVFEEEDSEGSLKDFIDDKSDTSSSESSSSSSSSGSGSNRSKTPPKKSTTRTTRATRNSSDEDQGPAKKNEWWSDLVTEEELDDVKTSSKIFIFFTILKLCEEIGDKLLVFSQSLYTLDVIEQFINLAEENLQRDESDQIQSLLPFSSNWHKGIDYFRLDGGTSSDNRSSFCKSFNNPKNTRARLFLISTKAGGLGINLTGANRVIIFDASWNPSFDVQSIFRVYRFGQDKPCFIYRFLSKGTIEEKIYERQVAKLSTSLRVIDEQQIDRHFSQNSLAELYAFNPDAPETRETPVLPKDRLMAELVQSYSDIILSYHQHDSLLENIEEEELNEEERKAAWVDFENDKNNVPPRPQAQGFQFNIQMVVDNLMNKIKSQNPTLNEEFVRQRTYQVLNTMPQWRQQVQQHQTQYYQQMQYVQQHRMLLAQQQYQMKDRGSVNPLAPKVIISNAGPSGSSMSRPSGDNMQTIEIQDD